MLTLEPQRTPAVRFHQEVRKKGVCGGTPAPQPPRRQPSSAASAVYVPASGSSTRGAGGAGAAAQRGLLCISSAPGYRGFLFSSSFVLFSDHRPTLPRLQQAENQNLYFVILLICFLPGPASRIGGMVSCLCPALFLPLTSAHRVQAAGLWEIRPHQIVVKPTSVSCCQMPPCLSLTPRTRDLGSRAAPHAVQAFLAERKQPQGGKGRGKAPGQGLVTAGSSIHAHCP